MKPKLVVYAIVFLILLLLVGLPVFGVYQEVTQPPADSPQGTITITVDSGDTLRTVAQDLVNAGVINSERALIWQEYLHPTSPLQTGEYILDVPATPEELLAQINAEIKRKEAEIAEFANKPYATITFREGLQLDQVFRLLEENGVVSQSEMQVYSQNPSNFDRSLYPFLPDPLSCEYGNIQTCAKYYPEGYVYPDTYNFFLNSTPGEVYSRFFSNFNQKVWSRVQPQAQNRESFHQDIIMASVIELETGRPKGPIEGDPQLLITERKMIAGVFNNRLDLGMLWQSDPTIVYGTGRTVCQQTLALDNCVLLDDPIARNLYNTYRNSGYPIGPVTSPQLTTIQAVLEPIANDNIFFVSDATGRKYFAATESGHQANISLAQQINSALGER